MFKIFVIGDNAAKTLSNAIYEICSAYGSVSWANEKDTVINFCTENISSFRVKAYSILVFGENLSNEICLPQADVCILDSGNRMAVYLAHKYHLTALTCSMSSYDTFTADAVTDYENILISLRRDIIAFDGTIIEPQDFPVHLSQETALYPIIASCAVLLLAGQPPKTNVGLLPQNLQGAASRR